MTTLDIAPVHECSVDQCSYNAEHACHAYAITIGGSHAHCDTFFETGSRGGLDKVVAKVGACHRSDCTHNDGLECHAEAIRVGAGADAADCLTYTPR